jgi:hypothetical protein
MNSGVTGHLQNAPCKALQNVYKTGSTLVS